MNKPAARKISLLIALLFLFSFAGRSQDKDSILQLVPSVKVEKERIRMMYLVMGDSGDNDPARALYYYKKLLALTKEWKDPVAEAVVTVEMGYALYFMGNTVRGTEMMLQGTRLAEKTGSPQAIGIAYDNLAVCYNEPVKKRAALDKALAASTIAGDYVFMCWEYRNIARIFVEQQQWDSAMYFEQRGLELALSKGIKEVTAGSLAGVGRIYYQRGQKALALEYFYAAARDPSTLEDAKTARNVYGSLAAYFLSEGEADSSIHYARKSFERTKDAFYLIQIPSVKQLAESYARTRQMDSAYKYQAVYYAMKDSMDNKLKLQQIELQLQDEEARQQTMTNERKHNLQYSAIALGVVALFIGFLLFSHSTIANDKLIRFLAILSLLIVFEFLNLLLHPYLGTLTHHEPVLMLAIMVGIAALLIPIHHKLEHWITHKMVSKNNRIRLEAAKRTVEQLEGKAGPGKSGESVNSGH
ncbi:MAG: hypothetical protein EOO15_07720 [Chitinophagaceae bacterium]|nr:MAG: hypothetical protein EOO15_07720 [Chitinophagaceae bacterium]